MGVLQLTKPPAAVCNLCIIKSSDIKLTKWTNLSVFSPLCAIEGICHEWLATVAPQNVTKKVAEKCATAWSAVGVG
eukprot:365080-Pelagomonas_calceolata.AAC.2